MEDILLESAVGIAVGVIGSVIAYLLIQRLFKKRRKSATRQIARLEKGDIFQAQNRGRIIVDKSVGKQEIHGNLRPVSGPPKDASRKPKSKTQDPRKKPIALQETVYVESGSFGKVVKHLTKGTKIRGVAEEVDDYAFDFYIVDDKQYVLLKRGEDPEELDLLFSDFDGFAYSFDETIPRTGDWFFVFDAYGKQLDREIAFRCTTQKKSR